VIVVASSDLLFFLIEGGLFSGGDRLFYVHLSVYVAASCFCWWCCI